MFLIAELQAAAGLAYVLYVAFVAFEGVNTISVVGYRLLFGEGVLEDPGGCYGICK
jgi:hypothetical protein